MNDEDAGRIFRLTLQLSTETLAEAAFQLEVLGIEAKEFFVLDAVEAHPYPAELSRHLSMPKPTVTAYLKNLQALGLIARAIDPQDLRRHRLEITPSGRDMLAKMQAPLFDRYRERLLRLSSQERDQFVNLFGKLVVGDTTTGR